MDDRDDLNPVEETDAILRFMSVWLERPTSEVTERIRSPTVWNGGAKRSSGGFGG